MHLLNKIDIFTRVCYFNENSTRHSTSLCITIHYQKDAHAQVILAGQSGGERQEYGGEREREAYSSKQEIIFFLFISSFLPTTWNLLKEKSQPLLYS